MVPSCTISFHCLPNISHVWSSPPVLKPLDKLGFEWTLLPNWSTLFQNLFYYFIIYYLFIIIIIIFMFWSIIYLFILTGILSLESFSMEHIVETCLAEGGYNSNISCHPRESERLAINLSKEVDLWGVKSKCTATTPTRNMEIQKESGIGLQLLHCPTTYYHMPEYSDSILEVWKLIWKWSIV